jgi:hypothetical protein
MHLEKVTGKNVIKKTYNRATLKKSEPFLFQNILFLGAFCHKGNLTFLESVSKEDSFDTHHDHIQ